MAFAPRISKQQQQQSIRSSSHKPVNKQQQQQQAQIRAPSSKYSRQSSRQPSRQTSPVRHNNNETINNNNNNRQQQSHITATTTTQLYEYSSITWSNILLLGYDICHDTTLNYTILHHYNSIKQFNHLIFYLLTKARSIQTTLNDNDNILYKDLTNQFKLCYPILDSKQQREFTQLIYNILNSFNNITTILHNNNYNIRLSNFVTPDYKLIPLLYYFTTYLLQQSMIYNYKVIDYNISNNYIDNNITLTDYEANIQIQSLELQLCNMKTQFIQHCNEMSQIQTTVQEKATLLTEQYNQAIKQQKLLQEQAKLLQQQDNNEINKQSVQDILIMLNNIQNTSNTTQIQYNELLPQLQESFVGLDGNLLNNNNNAKLDEYLNNWHVTYKQIERQLNNLFNNNSSDSNILQTIVNNTDNQLKQQTAQLQTLQNLMKHIDINNQTDKQTIKDVVNDNNIQTPIKSLSLFDVDIATIAPIAISPFNSHHSIMKSDNHTNDNDAVNDNTILNNVNNEQHNDWISAEHVIPTNQFDINDDVTLQNLRISSISHINNISTRFSLAHTTNNDDNDGLLDD